jgi:trehalose 6-phosphate synthase/phosphatase
MLGVDRLDMIKGIPQKILAFEKFLEENPDWNDRVVLLQIAVPTRTDVPECKNLFLCSLFTHVCLVMQLKYICLI